MISPPVAYADVGTRTLRQLETFNFPQTITSATTVALANLVPQRSQGDEIFAWYFTPYSTSSFIEIEILTNAWLNTTTAYIALFNDYQTDAMAVYPVQTGGSSYNIAIAFKHYFQPLQAGIQTRFSLRSAAAATGLTFNYYAYGLKNSSRVTMKEWSALGLQNV